jgi:hypothetical protein
MDRVLGTNPHNHQSQWTVFWSSPFKDLQMPLNIDNICRLVQLHGFMEKLDVTMELHLSMYSSELRTGLWLVSNTFNWSDPN